MSLRSGILTLGVVCALVASSPALHGQADPAGPGLQQAISANPFGLLFELFNAEYERVVSESSTAGFGGSFISRDSETYLNADVFWRFYMTGVPLDGWAFGAKAGLTNVPDQGTYFGFGFDFNRSWLLGKNDNFYLGIGFGLKRLLGVGDDPEDDDLLRFIPTFRIVNVGIAF
jgi:hypothetical protein